MCTSEASLLRVDRESSSIKPEAADNESSKPLVPIPDAGVWTGTGANGSQGGPQQDGRDVVEQWWSRVWRSGSDYSDGSLGEPSSLDEPAAILSADLLLNLLHFMHGYRCTTSTVEKIGMIIATGIPKIC